MTQVRPAVDADEAAVTATVTAAFATDPAWTFMLGEDAEAREAFARALLLPRLARRTVWVADDAAAVAMWDRRPAPAVEDPVAGEIWEGFRREAGEEVWARLEAYEDAMHAVGPTRPYWYLGVLATRPDAQGTGLATAVLQPGFEHAAQEGWDCWLETSTASNKAFYERRGFTHSVEVAMPPGGPQTWWLRRPGPR